MVYLSTFDPLGLKPSDTKSWEKVRRCELTNSRLATFAIACMLYTELLRGMDIIETRIIGGISVFNDSCNIF